MTFCVLGDCNQSNCHHCFPVKNCKDHKICIEEGICSPILETLLQPCKTKEYNSKSNFKILVTGCAGFIGSHLCEHLLKHTDYVIYGIDNINDYYDRKIKLQNLMLLQKFPKFTFKKDDVLTTSEISKRKPDIIIHLAASAGVRYSLENPKWYVRNNIEAFIHVLEEAKENNIRNVIYASSSSVYGYQSDQDRKFSESEHLNTFNSPYAASKYCMEIFAQTYHRLYSMNIVGMRFFTVYGPRGRPDMAPYKFLKNISKGKVIQKFGDGTTKRDYTYIDDVIEGIIKIMNNVEDLKCTVYNIGNSNPVTLNEMISTCEHVVERKAMVEQMELQKGDVPFTFANISKAENELSYKPKISLREGLRRMFSSFQST